ncbi:MAG: tRNA preQ1(34) S-adenosylmethionine ribosyltransferase-isomerase QueA [Planctomycetaceae bacterium]
MEQPDLNDITAWQYDLPPELIAERPAVRRDDSRLMVVDRARQSIRHAQMRDIVHLLDPSDRLVFNNTKVLPARLFGFRTSTKGRWEGLFLGETQDGRWKITGQCRGRLQPGETLTLIPASALQTGGGCGSENSDETGDEAVRLLLESKCEDGSWLVQPSLKSSTVALLDQFGTLPLPPYMGRKVADDDDRRRYQTVFATEPGAIAAPTAGLHFTEELLQECRNQNISSSQVTLHVGIGTFRPVNTDRLSDHQMHEEWCRLSEDTAAEIQSTRDAGHRIVAVGTTTVRTLEAAALAIGTNRPLAAWEGETRLFIQPGFRFQIVDRLLTNFHLPGSTLIVLVAALAGYELIMEAYRQAVAERYRFYSYGDAMLIL